MKKWLGLILAGLFAISCAACGGGSADQAEASGGKALVVYFSRSGEQYDVGTVEKGNTQLLAEEIAAQTGAKLLPGLAVPGETAQNDSEGTWQAVAEWLEGAGQE